MNSVGVKSRRYINFGVENDDKDPKTKTGDHLRISKFKNIFAKGYTPNWSEEVFVSKQLKNCPEFILVVLNDEEIFETFYKKELQKINEKEFRVEKVNKKIE